MTAFRTAPPTTLQGEEFTIDAAPVAATDTVARRHQHGADL